MRMTAHQESAVAPLHAETKRTLRQQFQRDFKHLDDEERAAVAGHALSRARDKGDSQDLVACLQDKAQSPPESGAAKAPFVDRRGCVLLTYNGSWGVLEGLPVPEHVMTSQDPLMEACRWLQTVPVVSDLWARFQQHAAATTARLNCTRWSASLELCPETLPCFTRTHERSACVDPSAPLRVHLHLFVESSGLLYVKSPDVLAFAGSNPFRSTDVYTHAGGRGRGARTAAAAGHYYVQAPKTSQVWMLCTHSVHCHMGMKAEWVNAYWQQGKLSDDNAIAEFMKVKKDCKRHIQNVRDLQAYRRVESGRRHAVSVQQRLCGQKLPRRFLPEVDHVSTVLQCVAS
jgi:hypothetical protein